MTAGARQTLHDGFVAYRESDWMDIYWVSFFGKMLLNSWSFMFYRITQHL